MHRHFLGAFLALPLLAASPAAEGLNRFAGDTYHQLAADKGNLIFSPLSISTALSMVLAGARGTTAAEIAAVLHTPVDAQLLDTLTRAGNASGDGLLMAQALWVDHGVHLLPDFVQQSEAQFHAAPTPLDFSKDPESARAAINQWTSQKTRDKIQNLFSPGSLKPATRLVLSSAIYFNGKWQSKFDPKKTSPNPSTRRRGPAWRRRSSTSPRASGIAKPPTRRFWNYLTPAGDWPSTWCCRSPASRSPRWRTHSLRGPLPRGLGSCRVDKCKCLCPNSARNLPFNLRGALSAIGAGGSIQRNRRLLRHRRHPRSRNQRGGA